MGAGKKSRPPMVGEPSTRLAKEQGACAHRRLEAERESAMTRCDDRLLDSATTTAIIQPVFKKSNYFFSYWFFDKITIFFNKAGVAELVYARDSKSRLARDGSSSLPPGTKLFYILFFVKIRAINFYVAIL